MTFFLLLVVVAQLFLLIYPMVRRKMRDRTSMLEGADAGSVMRSVALAAHTMLSSRRVSMSFNDDESLYVMLAGLKDRISGKHKHHVYAYYNFPLAFLLIGVLDHFEATGKDDSLARVEKKCGELLDETGSLTFRVDKPDQAVFGLLFLRLYQLTSSRRYINGAGHIYQEMQSFRTEDGLYRYRAGLNVFLPVWRFNSILDRVLSGVLRPEIVMGQRDLCKTDAQHATSSPALIAATAIRVESGV